MAGSLTRREASPELGISEVGRTVVSMYNGHGGEIGEGERNGYPVWVWQCHCGAKGKGSPDYRAAVNGLRKHCGLPAMPAKRAQVSRVQRPGSTDIRDW